MPRPKFDLNRAFHALGDPTRRALVERLSGGPAPASQLAAPLAITLTAVMQHLQILEQSGLIRTQKEGRVRLCQLEPQGLAGVERWAVAQRTAWERRLDRLGEILNE